MAKLSRPPVRVSTQVVHMLCLSARTHFEQGSSPQASDEWPATSPSSALYVHVEVVYRTSPILATIYTQRHKDAFSPQCFVGSTTSC
ncbi:hypothetical protein DOTSEDRAFT_45886 [Dothistroma septosporum NZE10]|uniref:Uncharacterized protein n=1 Tax=Dothistroma septosporum (strain NZE10 / CBS 128990) TaxID=675120 RepID=N1PLZ8_DOTSN|nr:hypothetical protein DOTSEDRAFT_45886 [Dothistroma septosporum NZE10]